MRIVFSGVRIGLREARRITAVAKRLSRALHTRGNIEVVFLDGRAMRILKSRLLPKEKGPANVIAAPEPPDFPHPESPVPFLGTLYLNRDLTAGEPEEEARLVLHGFLHLAGYDHKKKRDILRMKKTEETLWRRISSLVWI
ncbi:MAG: hypothetical protein A2122_03025 [Candidatus Liptonbacteria bacterium GWB1_49_6]|uniref:Uncharacterized protein n=1 Tax=Candidatus Liptonbacteria bacterium GWB1_49_6 TaxID=1798644 RepID=A0A1G2C9B0_9BACT|nr:MAG: hypothetical protein A2122_03025 [Candidatus Liptonbacteria bacterium GWB1_49_6]